MQSGDGLVARIRPRRGRLSSAQALALAELGERLGNGLLELTNRANLQIRGIRPDAQDALLAALSRLELIDADTETEAQRNILCTPFWEEGDDAEWLTIQLERALSQRPIGLPAKFGFAIDCGAERVLAPAPADIRVERSVDGSLMVRADGASYGVPVGRRDAVGVTLALAEWFLASGGARDGRGRMAAHLAGGAKPPEALTGRARPANSSLPPGPRVGPGGALVGLAFGQMQSATLKFLAERAAGLRMTPWRMILLESLREMPVHDGIVTRAEDPLLRLSACIGSPSCEAAKGETRILAATLGPHLPKVAHLHVSGCAKGCAHPRPCDFSLVATDDGYDLIRNGSAADAPTRRGLARAELLADPRAILEAR
jgi:precorrin-3B synthase